MKTCVTRRLMGAAIGVAVAGSLAGFASPAIAEAPSSSPSVATIPSTSHVPMSTPPSPTGPVQPAPAGTLAVPKGSAETMHNTLAAKPSTRLSPLADGECTSATTYNVTGSGGDATQVTVSTTAGGDRNCSMVQGNTGTGVYYLQSNMRDGCMLGDSALAVDGDFGPATKAELVLNQQTYGITADGEYGTETAGKVFWPAADGYSCIYLGI